MSLHKVETEDVEFSELVGQTIISFELTDQPKAFWGDNVIRYEIITSNNNKYWMTTGGGTNMNGFPGSQSHGVWLEKVTN